MTAIANAIRVAAAPWAPLVELTKPRLSLLVLFTALAGYVAGDGPAIPARILSLLVGTALVAGGANAINQVLERDADGRMERTRGRPSHRAGSALRCSVLHRPDRRGLPLE